MLVGHLMTRDPKTCAPDDSLDVAARLLWDHDVGVVPVVLDGRTVGVITDRDVCMAAYTQGRTLRELPVYLAMSKDVHVVRPDDDVVDALRLMRERQVRRLPVVDERGALRGILSATDLLLEASVGDLAAQDVVDALADIGRPRFVRTAAPSLAGAPS